MYGMLMRCNFRQQVQYRWNVGFQLAGDGLRLYIKFCIWQSLLQAGFGGDITFEDMVLYSMITSMMMVLTDSHVSSDLAWRVKSGMIAVDLIRPVSLKWYFFFSQLGENLYRTMTEGVILLAAALILFKPAKSVNSAGLLIFLLALISLTLAVFLMFLIQYTIGLLVFWMKDGTYTRMVANGLFTLFSGSVIPLWFYPQWLRKICYFLPFRLIIFEPVSLCMGRYHLLEGRTLICLQIFWLGIMSAAEWWIWKRIQSGIEIQGG